MVKLKRGEFIINGTHSSELNSLIQYRPEIQTPVRKVQMKPVPGVDGDYIFDEEAYENTLFSLELFTKGTSEEEVNDLRDFITYTFDSGDYIDFVPYWDPDMTYQVKTTNGPNYTPDGLVPLLLNYRVELSARPYKEQTESVVKDATQQLTIDNPSYYDTEPIITLFGTGNMNLIVNGITYPFQDIDTDIIVDSQIESAYRMLSGLPDSRNNRMYTMDFPVLKPGSNTISVTGNATSFKVETRWRKLVS